MRSQPAFIARGRRQLGFGLVEVLVALAIGLFVLLGLSSVFLAFKQSFQSQDQLAQLQDEERLALTVLTNTLQTAGYFPDPVTQVSVTALPEAENFAAGQGIFGTAGDADNGTSDTISVRYLNRLNDGIQDCLGGTNTTGPDTLMLNTFSISANHELVCSTDGGATTTSLVSNVQSMTVAYGTDTSNGGAPDRYLSAADVTTGTLWANVQTARITLTLTNPFAAQAGQPSTISWIHTINLMNRKSS